MIRRQQYEFLPDIEQHVIGQRDVDARILDLLDVVGQYRIRAPLQARNGCSPLRQSAAGSRAEPIRGS
jgi:hypothetical protein